MLPALCDALIRRDTWEVLPIFQLIRQTGEVPEQELYQVFNMGIGMVVVVHPEHADEVQRFIGRRGKKAWIIGEITRGTGKVRLE